MWAIKNTKKYFNQKSIIYTFLLLFFLVGIIGLYYYFHTYTPAFELNAISAANRTINSYFSALITVMALIITLTSNLYSPHLARMFVTHPLTLVSIFYVLLTNLLITVSYLIPVETPLYNVFIFSAYTLTNFATLGIIPTLYAISSFIRPSYFIVKIGSYACDHIETLNKKRNNKHYQKNIKALFSYIDILANMSSTAIQRKDKSVLKLVIQEQFNILNTLIEHNTSSNIDWRKDNFIFTSGISEEGKYHLKSNYSWPEAYLLAKILEESKSLNNTENELQSMLCRQLTNSVDKCIYKSNDITTRLILSIENAMIKDSIESKNSYKFSSLSYYYRINIELLIQNDKILNEVIESFIHYGEKCINLSSHRFAKSFIFDLGRILHYLSFENEEMAIKYFEKKFKPIYQKFLNSNNIAIKEMCQVSIAKTFWILYSQNYLYLTVLIKNNFLSDNKEHAKVLMTLFSAQNAIDKEYNDTFINVEYLSGMARALAKDFLTDFSEMNAQRKAS